MLSVNSSIRFKDPSEKSSYFFDFLYSYSKFLVDPDRVPPDKRKMWQQVIRILETLRADKVFDLGCGPGFFLQRVSTSLPKVEVGGFDFSHIAISMASAMVPSASLHCMDLRKSNWVRAIKREQPTVDSVLTALDVLQFLKDEHEFFGRIAGYPIAFTVPGFPSPRFFRSFGSKTHVANHYSTWLDICGLWKFESMIEGRPSFLVLGDVRSE